jgi:uncharacterized membrane protein YbhN (UPF0104 family)
MVMRYARSLLIAAVVFACCFLVLRFWLNLQAAAAAIAAGVSAAGTFFGTVLAIVKATLEVEKLRHENRKFKREETERRRVLSGAPPWRKSTSTD